MNFINKKATILDRIFAGLTMFLMVMASAGIAPLAYAGVKNPDTECAAQGFDFGIAKWEWDDGWHLEEDDSFPLADYSTNVLGTYASADWTSDPEVAGIVVKAGEGTRTAPGGTSGNITKGDFDLSHITFCGNEPTTGKITVVKDVGDYDGTWTFDFTGLGDEGFTLDDSNPQETFDELFPDDYKIVETVSEIEGFSLESVDCVGAESEETKNGIFVRVEAGDEITCTFTNTYTPAETCTDGGQNQDETGVDIGGVCAEPASITILKNTTDSSGYDMDFDFQSGFGSFTLQGDNTDSYVFYPPSFDGSYHIDEVNIPEGWQLDSVECTGNQTPISLRHDEVSEDLKGAYVTPNEDEQIICTFTNTPKKPEETKECTVTIVSDDTAVVEETGFFAKLLSKPVHTAWTAIVEGAEWIWSDNPVVDSTIDETKTFVNKFGWTGTVDSATLYIASDNSHYAELNGSFVGEATEEKNFKISGPEGQDVYDVDTNLIAQGNNELSVAVRNWGNTKSTPSSNPAGAKYKLEITTTDDVVCGIPYKEDPDTETITVCTIDETGHEEEEGEQGVPHTSVTLAVSNGEVSNEYETDEQTGCVDIDVDPLQGPWHVTQDIYDPWRLLYVLVEGGTQYPELELALMTSGTKFSLIPQAFAQTAPTAPVTGCTFFGLTGQRNYKCTFVNATTNVPSNNTSGGGRLLNPGGSTRGASDTRTNKDDNRDADDDDDDTIQLTAKRTGVVEGAQTSIVPTVAGASTGAGGTSPSPLGALPYMALFMTALASFAVLRTIKGNER